MSFGLEQEGGILITPMALAHDETYGFEDAFSPDGLCSRPETQC